MIVSKKSMRGVKKISIKSEKALAFKGFYAYKRSQFEVDQVRWMEEELGKERNKNVLKYN